MKEWVSNIFKQKQFLSQKENMREKVMQCSYNIHGSLSFFLQKKSTILDNSNVQEADAFGTNFAKFSVFVHRDKFSSAKNHQLTLQS